jgi:hypothetical protein
MACAWPPKPKNIGGPGGPTPPVKGRGRSSSRKATRHLPIGHDQQTPPRLAQLWPGMPVGLNFTPAGFALDQHRGSHHQLVGRFGVPIFCPTSHQSARGPTHVRKEVGTLFRRKEPQRHCLPGSIGLQGNGTRFAPARAAASFLIVETCNFLAL